MTVTEWVGLGTLVFALVANAYVQGLNFGDLKRGVKELIDRDDRTQKRIERVEVKVDDHSESISEIRAHLKLPHKRS